MNITGNENHDIPLSEASAWTASYRTANPGATIAHCFGKNAIQAIMDQEGCTGIRIYYALDTYGKDQLIIVGVDSSGNDLYTGLLAERSRKCPDECSSMNPLNS